MLINRVLILFLLLFGLASAQIEPPTPSEREAGFLFRQGLKLLEQGQHGRATDLFRRALRKEPERLEIRPYLARSLSEDGDLEGALRQLELYLEQEPSDTKVAMARVRTLARLDRLGQASDALDLLAVAYSERSWEWHNLKGFLAEKMEEYEEAEKAYQQAIELAPKEIEPAVNLVALWLEQDRLEDATRLVTELLSRAPEDPQVLNAFAMLLARKEEGFDPAPLLAKLKEQTLPFELQYNIAAALAEREENSEAAILAADLVDRFPDDARAQWLYGRILLAQRELSEAGDYLTAARDRLPLTEEIALTMGVYAFATRDYTEAVSWFKEALQREPGRASTSHNLSMALGRMDELEEAIEASRQAVELEPENPRFVYQLALMFDRNGDLQEAARQYRRFMELSDNEDEVEIVREHISELIPEE